MAVVFLQIAALSGLGIGQPLLQLVRQNPDFLMVHHSGGLDILIMAAALFLLLPLVLSLVVVLAGKIWAGALQPLHSLILGLLLFLILLPVIGRIAGVGAWLTMVIAAVPSAGLIFGLGHSRFLRQILTFLALSVPVFLAMFLGAGPIRRIILPDPGLDGGFTVEAKKPVVMIIFDELPTASLMTPDQGLDAQLFPNFARLAGMSTWYRNASTVSGATLRSVPAIMSGRFPAWRESPTLADHPRNIFTLLGPSYQVSSLESQTDLCPDDLKSLPVPGLSERLDLVFSDLLILYQHVVVPMAWRDRLVPVDNKWGDYKGTAGRVKSGGKVETKVDIFRKFINSLSIGNKPNLVVAHILLPHNPYRFFPDGKIFTWRPRVPLFPDGTWGPDELAIAHSYRRHLMQLATLDGLLGELLDRLEELGILNDAAMVVTADHGACFRPGLSHRRFGQENAADILSVPLFIKLPGQKVGAIDDRFVQTVDIFPTLLAGLGVTPGWAFDGTDLGSSDYIERSHLDFLDQDAGEHKEIPPGRLAERNQTITWKQGLFGSEGGWERLFAMGEATDLLGTKVQYSQLLDHPTLHAEIFDSEKLQKVNLNALFVPAEIRGTITGHDGNGRLTLAVALNGTIAGVTQTYLEGPAPGQYEWQVLIPLHAFINGSNHVELFLVDQENPQNSLWLIPVFEQSLLGVDMGGMPAAGVKEEGLFNFTSWKGSPARWTNGKGRWEFNLVKGERPESLYLKLVSTGPGGTSLKLSVNGTLILAEELPRGAWETQLPLNNVELGRRVTVLLESGVFVPAERDSSSSDRRELGVAVTSLVLK